jgi:hypothetical protein
MDKQAERKGRSVDLMGEDFIGIFLSEEVLCAPNKTTGDKLRRFIHDQEVVQNPRLVGSGEHGVVISAIIKDVEYVLKVVSIVTTSWRFLHASNMCRSSKNGYNPAPSLLLHIGKPSKHRRLRRSAEDLLG